MPPECRPVIDCQRLPIIPAVPIFFQAEPAPAVRQLVPKVGEGNIHRELSSVTEGFAPVRPIRPTAAYRNPLRITIDSWFVAPPVSFVAVAGLEVKSVIRYIFPSPPPE